jgi:hypothetical protein
MYHGHGGVFGVLTTRAHRGFTIYDLFIPDNVGIRKAQRRIQAGARRSGRMSIKVSPVLAHSYPVPGFLEPARDQPSRAQKVTGHGMQLVSFHSILLDNGTPT